MKQSLGNLLKELEQIRATLTVHIDVCPESFVISTPLPLFFSSSPPFGRFLHGYFM